MSAVGIIIGVKPSGELEALGLGKYSEIKADFKRAKYLQEYTEVQLFSRPEIRQRVIKGDAQASEVRTNEQKPAKKK